MSQSKKIRGFGTHLQQKHFKNSKAKTKHELQNEILSMSNQQLAVFDEIVNKAAAGKSMDSVHYPVYDIKPHAEIARKLKGHTHSQITLARRAREIPGGIGFGALINTTKNVAKAGAKVVVKGAKVAGKAAMKGAKVAGKALLAGGKKAVTWAMEHPYQTIQIGQTSVAVGSALMQARNEAEEWESDEKEIAPKQREAIDALLDTSDDDKKKGGVLALPPMRREKGGSNRWLI